MLRLLIPLSLLIACNGEDDTTPDPADDTAVAQDDTAVDPGEDAPYLGEVEEVELPKLDAEALESAVESALALATTIDPTPVIELYDALLATSDPSCPTWYTDDGLDYWYDSCISRDGTTFDGYGYVFEYDDYFDGSAYWTGPAVYSLATLTDAAGEDFTAAGSAQLLSGTTADGAVTTYSALTAGFAWTGGGYEGTWLADGLEPESSLYAGAYPEIDARYIVIEGAVTPAGGRVDLVVLETVLLATETIGSPCELEPSGGLSVLDGEGRWYDLIFDGPTWDDFGSEIDGCDGCGQVWFGGSLLGEICPDFSVALDWEQSPLE